MILEKRLWFQSPGMTEHLQLPHPGENLCAQRWRSKGRHRCAASAGDSNKGGIYDPAGRVKRTPALRTAKTQEKPSFAAVEASGNLLPRVLQVAVTTGSFTGTSSSLLFPAPGSPKNSLFGTCVLTQAEASRPSEQSDTC